MKKAVNKKKFGKILLILALIAVVAVLVVLIVKGALSNNDDVKYYFEDEQEEGTHELTVYKQEPMKSSEDLYAEDDFLKESFNEFEDGDRFYLAGTSAIDYDKELLFFGDISREEIVEAIGWNYEEITDKTDDENLVVYMKGNVLVRLFKKPVSECGFKFVTEDENVMYVAQSNLEDAFFKTKVEDGLKIHVLDYHGLNEATQKEIDSHR